MSMEIDSLEIAIQSQAQGAVKELNALYSTLGNISAALNRSAHGYRSTAKEIGRVSAALQTLARIRIPDFSKAISQIQMLSGLELKGISKKAFTVDIDINIPKTQEQIAYALEQASKSAQPDTTALADSLIREFNLTGSAAERVRQYAKQYAEAFAQGFDWKSMDVSGSVDKAFDQTFENMVSVINQEGTVLKQDMDGIFTGMEDAYSDFYEYIKNKPLMISDALKAGIGAKEFEELFTQYPGMLARTAEKGVVEVNAIWEEMTDRWPSLFPKDTVNDADQVLLVLQRISEARESLGETPILKLKGEDAEAALENTSHSVYSALNDFSTRFRETLRHAATNNKDLMIDLEVNQDKIVKDIQSAVNKASKAVYDPVKINLKIDKQHVTNAIADELKNMNAGSLPEIASAYERLGKAIGTLYTVSSNHKAISQMVNAVRRLANTDMSQFDTGKFSEMTTSIQGLAELGDAAQNVNRLVNALTRLANSGSNMAQAANALPALGNGVRIAAQIIGQANFDETSARLVSAISRLASSAGNMGLAATNLPTLTASVQDFFTAMSQAPEVSDNTVRMTEALAQLAGKGAKVDRATSSVANGMKGMQSASHASSSAIKDLEAAMKKLLSVLGSFGKGVIQAQINLTKFSLSAITGFKGINQAASGIGKATISLKNLLGVALGFYGIRSLFNWGKQAIELSSDLTEVQNVVENAFGEEGTKAMEKFTETSIQTLGMSELTAKQIASRYQAMGVAMGITSGQVAEATERVSSRMAESYDRTGDSMSAMSLNLTRLAADMASFYNVEQDTVAEALNAVYTGQTRPLRQYGLDLTQATLQEWANKQGIDAKISSMSQAEKTMLRYQYVMANTAVVQGDFARTSMTWANQIRILKQNFEVLGKTIGGTLINVFRPLVSWLNTAMAKVIAFAETVGNALGKIFGWTILHTPAGNASSGVEDLYDMSDSLSDVGDSANSTAGDLDKATAAAQELQATVLGFDQLNKLNDATSGSSGSPSSGSGSGSGLPSASDAGVGDASGADFQLVQTESWLEHYKSQIDSLWELGDYIGKTLTDVLNGIDWDSVYLAASSFGAGLASFLNGLISPELFDAVGKTIANSLNTALHALDTFGSVFSWTNFGTSIGVGIRSFFENFDWELTAKTFDTFVNGYTKAFYAAIDQLPTYNMGKRISNAIRQALSGINWNNVFDAAAMFGYKLASFLNGLINEDTFSEIGTAVGNALHAQLLFLDNFGQEMDFVGFGNSIAAAINSFFGSKFSFSKLALTFWTWATGILDTMLAALSGIDFEAIGRDIGDAIRKIRWDVALDKMGDLLGEAIQAQIRIAKGIIDPTGLGTPLTDALQKLADKVDDLTNGVNWKDFTQHVRDLVQALSPAVEGFAVGLINFFVTLADIGEGALNAIGDVFEAISMAINALPDGVVRTLGRDLGLVAGALVTINGLDKVVGIIGGVVGKLTGMGAAASTAAGGTVATATATGGLKGALGGVLKTLVSNTTFMEGAFISATVKSAEVLQRMGDEARGGNGELSDLGTLMGNIATDFSPELNQAMFELVEGLEDAGIQGEEAAQALAEFFTNEGIDPTKLEAALRRAQGELNQTGGDVDTVERALELMGDMMTTTSGKALLSEQDYASFNTILKELASDGIIPSTEHMEALQAVLAQDQGAATASEAYDHLKTKMSEMGIETDELEQKAKTQFPGIFNPLSEGAADADTKTGNLKTGLGKFLGGLAGQAVLTAVMKVALAAIGDSASESGDKIGTLDGKVSDTITALSNQSPTARKTAKDLFGAIPEGGAAGIEEQAHLVTHAVGGLIDDNVIGTAREGLNSHSPSKVFEEIGRNVDEGLVNGINNTVYSVNDAARKLISGMLSIVDGFGNQYHESGKKLANEVKSGFGSVNIRDTVNKMFDASVFNNLSRQLYNAGQSAAKSLKSGLKSVYMPSLSYYISNWDYHSLGNGGYSYTPRFSAQWYALGGFPNMGELFVANEAGPEMIGKMGRKNVVANNMQIAEGIKSAVVEGMMEVAAMNRYSSEAAPSYQLTATLYTENNVALARAVDKGRLIQNDRNVNRY